jgi:dTDP-4-amino-4,6-dideoxygalactose transaminase
MKVVSIVGARPQFTKATVSVNSCTAGLHLSMLAAGLGEGDEVIATPMTFCATVNSRINSGMTQVLQTAIKKRS